MDRQTAMKRLSALQEGATGLLTKKQLPNTLTFGRIGIVVVLLLITFYAPGYTQLLFWLFAIAAVSDYLDGYLARKWKAASNFGAMLDQISDKLLVAVTLIYLIKYDVNWLLILPGSLIILRELYVSGLREFLALRKVSLPVSLGGKWKTAIQLIAIGTFLFGIAYGIPVFQMLGRLLIWAAAGLALYSAYTYTKATLPHIR